MPSKNEKPTKNGKPSKNEKSSKDGTEKGRRPRSNAAEKPRRQSRTPRLEVQRRKQIMKVAGLLVAAFAVFTLIAVVSYMFTWKADQSLLDDPDMMRESVKAHNSAGKLGIRWGHFLMARCFGLGSFALIFLLGVISVRLLFGRWRMSIVKAFFVTVTGAVISSFLLALISRVAGLVTVFEGGLGGDCGDAIASWSVNLVGTPVTFIIVLILVFAWLLFSSRRFSAWMLSLFEKVPDPSERRRDSGDAGRDDADGGSDADDCSDVGQEDVSDSSGPAPDKDTDSDSGDVSDGGDDGSSEVGDEFDNDDSEDSEASDSDDGGSDNDGTDNDGGSDNDAGSDGGDGPDIDSNHDAGSVQDTGATMDLDVIRTDLQTEVKKDLPRIDVRDELPDYKFPSLDLLKDYQEGRHEVPMEELERNNNKIRVALLSYKIQVERVSACVGPTVTLYKIIPAKGVKISAIRNLEDDIALSLGVKGVRVVTLEDAVGIEVPNDRPSIVPLKLVLNDDAFRNCHYELPVAIGVTITNKVKVFDLANSPHLLIAGATQQGKSVGLNVIISSLLYSKHPSELKFVFIDPKEVEFTLYSRLLKHYLAVLPQAADEAEEMAHAIVKHQDEAEKVLGSLCVEMDERYKLISRAAVRNIKEYNNKYRDRHLLPTEGHHFLPYIVVVIDEYADLIMSGGAGGDSRTAAKNIMNYIVRLAQKGRAAGMHVILATQRPSVNVVTGMIKANFPTRIAFRTASRTDSATILDSPGANKLMGRGDMLYYAGVEMERMQCAFVDKEVEDITRFIGDQTGFGKSYSTPYYLPEPPSSDGASGGAGLVDMQHLDPLFEEAARSVVMSQIGSTTALQRKLGMGYARAGRVMDQLEAAGIVGPQESSSKPRQVLVQDFNSLDEILESYLKP